MPFRLKDIAILSFAQIVNTGLGFLLLPFLARTFELKDFGTYSQVLTISGLFTTFFGFGLATVLIPRLVSQIDHQGQSKAFSSVVAVGIFGGILCLILMTSMAQPMAHVLNNDELIEMLPLYCVAPMLSILIGIFNSALVVTNRVKTLGALTVLNGFLKYAFLFFAIKFLEGLSYVLVFLSISDLLVVLMHLRYNRFRLRINGLEWNELKSILQSGLALSSTVILGALILNLDSLIVAHLLSTEQFAIYKNGAIEVPFFATLYASITAISFPHISKSISEKKDYDVVVLKRKIILYTAVVVYPVLVFLLFNSSEIILIYLSERYILSASVFWIFNLTLLIRINDYADVLIARNQSKFILLINLIGLAVNLPLNYFLVRTMGIQGAAVCTVITVALVAVLQVVKTNSLLKQRIFSGQVLGNLGLILVISFMAVFVSKWLVDPMDLHPLLMLGAKFVIVIFMSLSLIIYANVIDRKVFFDLVKSWVKKK